MLCPQEPIILTPDYVGLVHELASACGEMVNFHFRIPSLRRLTTIRPILPDSEYRILCRLKRPNPEATQRLSPFQVSRQ